MLQVALVLITVQLFAEKDKPVLLQVSTTLLLLKNFALVVYGILSFASVARVRVRRTGKPADAVSFLEINMTTSNTWRHLLRHPLHAGVWVDENLFLTHLITF